MTSRVEPERVVGVIHFRAVSDGVRATIVAGEVVVGDDSPTEVRPGQIVGLR